MKALRSAACKGRPAPRPMIEFLVAVSRSAGFNVAFGKGTQPPLGTTPPPNPRLSRHPKDWTRSTPVSTVRYVIYEYCCAPLRPQGRCISIRECWRKSLPARVLAARRRVTRGSRPPFFTRYIAEIRILFYPHLRKPREQSPRRLSDWGVSGRFDRSPYGRRGWAPAPVAPHHPGAGPRMGQRRGFDRVRPAGRRRPDGV